MWYPGKTPIFEESLILNPKSKYSENMSIIVICVLKMSQTVTFFIFNLLTIYGEFFIHTFKLSNKKLQFKIFINQRALSTTPNLQQTFNLYTTSSVDLENTCLVNNIVVLMLTLLFLSPFFILCKYYFCFLSLWLIL